MSALVNVLRVGGASGTLGVGHQMQRLRYHSEGAMNPNGLTDINLLMCLSAFAFILGFIAGIAVKRRDEDPPRHPAERDVWTPGHKVVAMPARAMHAKPSSAWPQIGRESRQRVQSQVESGNAA